MLEIYTAVWYILSFFNKADNGGGGRELVLPVRGTSGGNDAKPILTKIFLYLYSSRILLKLLFQCSIVSGPWPGAG